MVRVSVEHLWHLRRGVGPVTPATDTWNTKCPDTRSGGDQHVEGYSRPKVRSFLYTCGYGAKDESQEIWDLKGHIDGFIYIRRKCRQKDHRSVRCSHIWGSRFPSGSPVDTFFLRPLRPTSKVTVRGSSGEYYVLGLDPSCRHPVTHWKVWD